MSFFLSSLFLCGCDLTSTPTFQGQFLPAPAPQTRAPIVYNPPPALIAKAPTITGVDPARGAVSGGTSIVITGSGFTPGNTSVWVGGVPCQYVSVLSPSTLTCKTGSNTPGTKSISVTNVAGASAVFPYPTPTSSSNSRGFTYFYPPPILYGSTGNCPPLSSSARSSICPVQGSTGSSVPVTIVGYNFLQGATVRIGNQTCCGASVSLGQICPSPTPSVNNNVQPNTISCYAPPNPEGGSVQISVTNPNDNQTAQSTDFPFTFTDPANLNYPFNQLSYVVGSPIPTNSPTVTTTVAAITFSIYPTPLPSGITFSTSTGMITGTPTEKRALQTYYVTATHSKGSTRTSLPLVVVDFGSSSAGPQTVTGTSTFNSYAYITDTSILAGSKVVNVSNVSGFAVGSEVLVIQMQATDGSLVWEPATIAGLGSSSVTFSTGLSNSYSSGSSNVASGAAVAQMVSLPNYSSVTVQSAGQVNAKPWDGQTGGVIAFRSDQTTTVNGTISAAAAGYRGGNGATLCSNMPSCNLIGFRGENWNSHPNSYGTYAPTPTPTYSGTDSAGGGGIAELSGTAAGGGGGYGSVGSTGANTGSQKTSGAGGKTAGTADLSYLLMGPGGGGGVSLSCADSSYMTGGTGGGIIFLYTRGLTVSSGGVISARGASSSFTTSCANTGAGAGGSIFITASTFTLNSGGTVTANGGSGLNGGGQGGDGRIRIDAHVIVPSPSPDPLTSPVPGYTSYPQ